MTYRRHKGVVLIDTKKGILVVSGRSKIFALPGGAAKTGESRKSAAIRELREETGLRVKDSKYLFSYRGKKWKNRRNYAKVFLIKAKGWARARNEIKHIAYWKPGSKLRISWRTQAIINQYLKDRKD